MTLAVAVAVTSSAAVLAAAVVQSQHVVRMYQQAVVEMRPLLAVAAPTRVVVAHHLGDVVSLVADP